MTHDEALDLIMDVRTRFDEAYGQKDKTTIERVYFATFGKRFVPTTCQNCYHDATIELYIYLKNNTIMAQERKYELKKNVVLSTPAFYDGAVVNNSNLTDELAEKYLAMYPHRKDLFIIHEEAPVEEAPVEVKPKRSHKKGEGTGGKRGRKPKDEVTTTEAIEE